MPSTLIDTTNPWWNAPLDSRPRGLVRHPQHVVDWVTRERARLAPNYGDEYAKQSLDWLTVDWYYQGIPVAYRSRPEGVEILAVGYDEVAAFRNNTPTELCQDVRFGQS
jgi:hypothetical protein